LILSFAKGGKGIKMENSDSVYDALKGILGENADEKINSVLSSISGKNENNTANSLQNAINPKNMEYLMKLRNVIDEMENVGDDNRSRLLMSLKPYMRNNRQQSIDSAIRLLNLTKISGLFK